tara:strand:- start:1439 stop:2263 length:825 start_codon:yes stop_codon:yes gene_type:complete
MINVYTDGACINNGKPNAISGYGVYFSENDTRNESEKIKGDKHTNNIAELTAFIRALEILQDDIIKNVQINIYTDSEYVIKCASNYGEKLSINNWKTSNNKNPPNVELVKKAHELFKDLFNVKLIHINAHTNKQDIHSIGNKMADKLANLAIGAHHCPYYNDKTYINISFKNKDTAKKLGAKWDTNKKSWYYDNKISDEYIKKLNELEDNTIKSFVADISSKDNDNDKNYINISFAKKNIAKSYGAKWDNSVKKWYYLNDLDQNNQKKLRELES